MLNDVSFIAVGIPEIVISAGLIQQALSVSAEVLGTTRVTITRTMGKLESQGIIHDLTQRWLFIDRSTRSSATGDLRTHLPISVSSSSILPHVGVVSPSRERSLSIRYR